MGWGRVGKSKEAQAGEPGEHAWRSSVIRTVDIGNRVFEVVINAGLTADDMNFDMLSNFR